MLSKGAMLSKGVMLSFEIDWPLTSSTRSRHTTTLSTSPNVARPTAYRPSAYAPERCKHRHSSIPATAAYPPQRFC